MKVMSDLETVITDHAGLVATGITGIFSLVTGGFWLLVRFLTGVSRDIRDLQEGGRMRGLAVEALEKRAAAFEDECACLRAETGQRMEHLVERVEQRMDRLQESLLNAILKRNE